MNARSVFGNLLGQLDVDVAQASSFLNWHAVGFDYLCLHRAPGLTVKLYMNRPGELRSCGNGDYLVNPHDHAYNFDTHVINGVVTNVIFRATRRPTVGVYNLWDYDPSSKDATPTPGTWELKETHRIRFRAGSGYCMFADEIHTIELRGDDSVCMLLMQYESHRAKKTRLFTESISPPDRSGLYVKPTRAETLALIDRAFAFANEPRFVAP